MLTDQQLARMAALQGKYTHQLLKKAHVVGVSIGPIPDDGTGIGGWGLIVLVDRVVNQADLAPEDQIPSEIEGVPVMIREVGRVKAF